MTTREFFENVITMVEDAEMQEKAKSLIDALDRRNAKRAERPSKTAIANEPIKAEIAKVLTTEPMTASTIAKLVDISTQKASALLRQMDIKVTDVKVKGKGTQKGYYIAE
jgi:hypothetical protein